MGIYAKRALAGLALACLSINAASAAEKACDPYAVRVATDPVPYQWPHGLKRADQLIAQPPARADIVLFGDSLLANWPEDQIRRQFGARLVWNAAVGGAMTQHALWLLERMQGRAPQALRVVLLVGTNNLTYDYMPPCAIAAGIRKVAEKALVVWPKARLDLVAVPPRGADFRFRDVDRKALNAELAAWAAGRDRMRFVEIDTARLTCSAGDAPSDPKRPTCGNYADDYGHFRRAGYEVIFSALAR
ncbi:SGNH/GDSL hydrolase family protein [Rhizobium sp. TRM95796]|uniref:SGNH/GDSL hydrolase family protein n=1 Tax=Rhizobium sp. TRM95796 TaxID=2979862 RepID=UPI0021E7DC41|nr:GDSL-type esterase/lipase family protein [Rhizobium sp. TRM95796]MCV3767042.1 GDSL-type esterase/lipase family protein [Rhizobium sp. TRM95796]